MMDEVVDATRRQHKARNTPFIDYLGHRHASSEFARAEALHVQLIRMTYCLATRFDRKGQPKGARVVSRANHEPKRPPLLSID